MDAINKNAGELNPLEMQILCVRGTVRGKQVDSRDGLVQVTFPVQTESIYASLALPID